MTKRLIKIVILFILMIIIIVGGWLMYKRLEYNKQSYSTNIYDHIPAQTTEIFNINKEYNLKEVFTYDSAYTNLLNIIHNESSYPLILYKDSTDRRTLLLKIRKEEEQKIEDYIRENIALAYKPQIKEYNGNKIVLYPLSNDDFLVCTFHKGVFAASHSYKAILDFTETDSTRSFFAKTSKDNIIEKTLTNAPVGLFLRTGDKITAFDYKTVNDTIKLNGYILNNEGRIDKDSILSAFLPYRIEIPHNLCIDNYKVSDENNNLAIRIILNKMY